MTSFQKDVIFLRKNPTNTVDFHFPAILTDNIFGIKDFILMQKNNYLADFVENEFFHVYNRTNNKELLFKNNENKNHFLNRYDHYSYPFLETYSWNLLPNHFHFLVRVTSIEAITAFLQNKPLHELCKTEKRFLVNEATIHDLIDNVIRRFLISYTMSFNSIHERKGNLLHRPFKRVHISNDSQFTQTVIYINANAIKHKLVADFTKYKWSSYHTIISNLPAKLWKHELLDWFGGKEKFIKTMEEQTKYYYCCENLLDDD